MVLLLLKHHYSVVKSNAISQALRNDSITVLREAIDLFFCIKNIKDLQIEAIIDLSPKVLLLLITIFRNSTVKFKQLI